MSVDKCRQQGGSSADCAEGYRVYSRHRHDNIAFNLFAGPSEAQPWIDALTRSLKALADERGVKYDDTFAVGLSVQEPFGMLQPQEAGSTWSKEKLVWLSADQPPLFVAATLAHELVHTRQPTGLTNDEAHTGDFIDDVKRMGLLGPWTATQPSEAFEEWYLNKAPKPEEFGAIGG